MWHTFTLILCNGLHNGLSVKIRAGVSAVSDLRNPAKYPNKRLGEQNHACDEMKPLIQSARFCMIVDIPCIVTYARFGDNLLRGLRVAVGVKFCPFPLTLIVVLTTLSHYCASVKVEVNSV